MKIGKAVLDGMFRIQTYDALSDFRDGGLNAGDDGPRPYAQPWTRQAARNFA